MRDSGTLGQTLQENEDAYIGYAGDLMTLMHKTGQTEASRIGVLAHLLAFVGNYVGNGSFVMVGDDKHAPNIWPIIIGETAAGKGTSAGPVRRTFTALDENYMRANLVAGLGSGEGIIDRLSPEEDDDGNPHYPDPRLLVVEEEFTSVLKKGRRDGSILANTLQTAWDGKPLGVLNRKENSYAADDHQVTVIGHATPRAIDGELTANDFANGFVNRLTFIRVNVQPAVARPAGMTDEEIDASVSMLREIFTTVHQGEYRLTDQAWKEWERSHERYRFTGDTRSAEALGRTRAQVIRLALIYAIIDCSKIIDTRHLRAAIAVVDHSVGTVKQLFGDEEITRLGKVVAKFRETGNIPMTSRDIRRIAFGGGRQQSSSDAREWLEELVDDGVLIEVPSERNTKVYISSEAMTA